MLLLLHYHTYHVQHHNTVHRLTHPLPALHSETTIGEVVSTNGVELDAALDALRGKANAQEVAVRQEKTEKAVAEVCVGFWGGLRLWDDGVWF